MATMGAVGLAACSSGNKNPSALVAKQLVRQQNRASAVKASVSANNQSTNGFSVAVDSVTYPNVSVADIADEGVVTVAPLVNDKPGDVAGFTVVRQGTSTNVTVPIRVQLRSGTYRVALYSGSRSPSAAERPLAGTDVTLSVP